MKPGWQVKEQRPAAHEAARPLVGAGQTLPVAPQLLTSEAVLEHPVAVLVHPVGQVQLHVEAEQVAELAPVGTGQTLPVPPQFLGSLVVEMQLVPDLAKPVLH